MYFHWGRVYICPVTNKQMYQITYPKNATRSDIQDILEKVTSGPCSPFMDTLTLTTLTIDAADSIRTECLEKLGKHEAEWCKQRFTEEFPQLVKNLKCNKLGLIVVGLKDGRGCVFPSLEPCKDRPWLPANKYIVPFDRA